MIRPLFFASFALTLGFPIPLGAAELTLTAPRDFQVVQRSSPGKGLVRMTGELTGDIPAGDAAIEARLTDDTGEAPWLRVGGTVAGRRVTAVIPAAAG